MQSTCKCKNKQIVIIVIITYIVRRSLHAMKANILIVSIMHITFMLPPPPRPFPVKPS